MLSVNPASSGSSASSATDNSSIAAFVSQNSIGILAVVPSRPTSVVATSGNASLAVTWVAPTSTGGSAITEYLVKYSSNNGAAGSWTRWGKTTVIAATSCTVTGLTNGTAYVIKVIAKNAIGISLPSANSAPATPAATVPGSPTAVVAVSGNASLAVSWTAPANTGGSAITEYLVKYSSNGGVAGSWTRWGKTTVIAATSCTVTGLTNGTAYVIKVIAKNAVGISPPSANSAPVTPALLAMSMVTVGNPGNAADTTSYGAVSYSYQIGAYDVTGLQYTAFLNAVGSTDTYGLYNASMGTDTKVAQISRTGSSGSYTYAVVNNTGDRPITYVSWFDSARFSNWMSNGQPSGAQTHTTTENGAYNVNGTTLGNAVAANATNPNTLLAPTHRIPLENEWYKAAYYKGGSTKAGYWTYATKSDTAPVAATARNNSPNQANYNNLIGHATAFDSFPSSGSSYGTFDQSGNVYQWNDLDGTAGSFRELRGGSWADADGQLSRLAHFSQPPSLEGYGVGFRLASPVTTTLTPTFGSTTATADGFTVPITNYDSSYTWVGTATASGLVAISGTGLVTVTGVAPGTSSTATITTTKSNTVGGSAPVTATSAVAAALTPTFGSTTATTIDFGPTIFTTPITNYDSSYSWAGTATVSGTVAIDGTGLVTVTVGNDFSNVILTATITTAKSNTAGGTATIVLMKMNLVRTPGNAADTTSYGAVSYSYQIGKYDVTGSQYTAFLNAVGSTDTYGLYNSSMGTDPNSSGVAQINRSGTSGSYTYAVLANTGLRPITYVSWFDSARFSNWMSNGQPTGAQTPTTTENGAYNVNGTTSGIAVAANATNPNTGSAPTFRMPTENEWYKAAYYEVTLEIYYRFATMSNDAPGTTRDVSTNANVANYYDGIGYATDVGWFSGSWGPSLTYDQTGNVWQWNDLDGTAGSSRGLRGGSWSDNSNDVSSSGRFIIVPSDEDQNVGFRLAGPV